MIWLKYHTLNFGENDLFLDPFKEVESLVGFEEASYTILSLVVLADSLMTGLCGK